MISHFQWHNYKEKDMPKKETLKTPENTPELNEQQVRQAPHTYPVVAPDNDVKLMVALIQVLDYFRTSRKDLGADEDLTAAQEELALGWFNEKAQMEKLQ
jgi:hypothetical protein